ncbi:P-loop containing nucleoside triphosphate hydrolase protein [Hyaloraphidium curvatum]|nr:P-loop containing nucleoside triphosphate hydrolase protein [Hyaloraphidium curvatum]
MRGTLFLRLAASQGLHALRGGGVRAGEAAARVPPPVFVRPARSRQLTTYAAAGSLIRIPMAIGAMGAGAAAYIGQKVSEVANNPVFEWMSNAADSLGKMFSSDDKDDKSKDKDKEEERSRKGRPDNEPEGAGAAAAAALAASSLAERDDDDRRGGDADEDEDVRGGRGSRGQGGGRRSDDEFMVLTRKLIEVRNILKTIDHDDALHLPSIVVVGSQSSGKSSVLESIVGQEFLPKGTNMVTRRPIELTLIYTPDSNAEYAEFPQLGLGKVSDFTKVQRTLSDLNLAVPESECVSDKPIELRIYSPNVPDLTMVDLPGYIQITNKNQPPLLKQKIQELCDKYISENNIVLAVSAADVDLANSEALRASRKVDPLGLRTIGVITKMDLVDPNYGVGILRTTDYPLELGYVGVVCKPKPSGRESRRGGAAAASSTAITPNDDFFRSFPIYSARDIHVGVAALRKRLMDVLEDHMGRSLYGVVDAVEREVEETNYQFKVQYNDRRISAESYVAETIDQLKQRFKNFAAKFGKPQVREEVRKVLQDRLMEACRTVYYNDPAFETFSSTCLSDAHWAPKLNLSSSVLTKSGIGRICAQRIVDTLSKEVQSMLENEPFVHHPEAREKITALTTELIRDRFSTTVDQVENAIKPFKTEVDISVQDWADGQKKAVELVESQLQVKEKALQTIKAQVGRRKLRMAIRHVENIEKAAQLAEAKAAEAKRLAAAAAAAAAKSGKEAPPPAQPAVPSLEDGPRLNPKLLEKAKEARDLRQQILALRSRISVIRSRQCRVVDNKTCCPEVFLAALTEKLTTSAVMFLQVELLNEFFFQWPREVDNRLYYDMSRNQISDFARQNVTVRRHLDLQDRKEKLNLVMEKLGYLQRRQQELRHRRN